jgi:hypothetical protein
VIRWLAFALVLTAGAMAQTNDPAKNDEAPISGHVLNAVNGRPIAGATVHYRAGGGDQDKDHNGVSPATREGDVTTGADGSYSVPDLPRGPFDVRATAPGYFGAHDVIAAKPAGDKPAPIIGRPADEVLRLKPDLLDLRPISDVAMAKLNQQEGGYEGVSYPAPEFTPDGNRVVFLVPGSAALQDVTRDDSSHPGSCAALAYDLSNGRLTELGDSLPADYCVVNSTEIAWDGDLVYVYFTDYNSNPIKSEAMRLQGGKAAPWPVADLPRSFEEKLARKAASGAADKEAEARMRAETVWTTSDGRFTLRLGEGDLGQCNSLVAASKQPQWEQTVAACAFPSDYELDRGRDLLFLSESALLVEYNLKTRRERRFALPESEIGPDLLAFQPLANGATRMVYTLAKGDCDPAATGHNEGSADSESASTKDHSSICFITIPPP